MVSLMLHGKMRTMFGLLEDLELFSSQKTLAKHSNSMMMPRIFRVIFTVSSFSVVTKAMLLVQMVFSYVTMHRHTHRHE